MSSNRLRVGLGATAAALCLLWPALFNGQALFMSDTSAYIRGAAMGVRSLTGLDSPWIAESAAASRPAPPATDARADANRRTSSEQDEFRSLSSVEDKTVLAGRSVYYGALLLLGSLTETFWPTVLIQALLLVLAVHFTLQTSGLFSAARAAWVYAGLCLTPAALFASYLMPDVFAGLTILSCAGLLIAGDHHHRWRGAFWFLLLCFSLLAHASHVLLAISLLLVAGLLDLLGLATPRRRGLAAITGALVVSFAGSAAFDLSVRRFIGEPPIRPPFLVARMIADGPGFDYLRTTCPGSGFVACEYLDRMPATADEFLWSLDPKVGVFALVDPQTRRALAGEQYRFVLQVMRHQPLRQLRASAKNALRQLASIDAKEFEYSDWDRRFYQAKLPRSVLNTLRGTAAYNGRMPIGALTAMNYGIAFLALAYLVAVALSSRRRDALQATPELSLCLTLVVAGIVVNAAICGAMSTPHDRYQARVIWLLPLVAMMVAFRVRAVGRPEPTPVRVTT